MANQYERIRNRTENVLDGYTVRSRGSISALELLRRVGKDVSGVGFSLNASAMAFNFFLALFPALIAFFSLIAYIPIDNLELHVRSWMTGALPPAAMVLINETLHELFENRNAGVLSIAFATVIYSSMRGLYTLFNAFEQLAHRQHDRPFYIKYGLALLLSLLLFLLVVVLIAVYVLVELAANNLFVFLNLAAGDLGVLFALRHVFTVGMIYLAVSLTYKVASPPAMKMPFFSLGTIICTVFLWLALFGLRYFFANFTNYNGVYGSLTAVIVLMVWFYWLSNILLLGYDIHIRLNEVKEDEKLTK